MELTAIFESWHIGDGNYPPLRLDQEVRLSFELEPSRIAVAPGQPIPHIQHHGNAKYTGVGVVLRRYHEKDDAIAVIECDAFRFYFYGSEAAKLVPGTTVEFEGTLLLDHYLWVEFVHAYPDPPDLFYNLRVARIQKVVIPERFVQSNAHGTAFPTRVDSEDFGVVEELDTMEGQRFDEEFYILAFNDTGMAHLQLPQTFR
jgi:hypothetical protein